MPKVGCQIIIFRERRDEGLAGLIDDIKKAGYEGFETQAYLVEDEAREVKGLCEANGLSCAGFHGNVKMLEDEENIEKLIASMKIVGTNTICNSGVYDRSTIDGYKRSCEVFNKAGKRLQSEGLSLCYHNHAWEFETLEGTSTRGIDIILNETDPNNVKLCIDVYWVAMGNDDPAQFIRDNLVRGGYYHFKDGSKDQTFLPLGKGFVDLKACAEACEEAEFEWVVVEQDQPDVDAVTDLTTSRDYLKALGY